MRSQLAAIAVCPGVTVDHSHLPPDRARNGHAWLSSLLTLKSQEHGTLRWCRAVMSKYSADFLVWPRYLGLYR